MWGMRQEGQNYLFHAQLTVHRWKHGWNGTEGINLNSVALRGI
jgi:hypothetical protein